MSAPAGIDPSAPATITPDTLRDLLPVQILHVLNAASRPLQDGTTPEQVSAARRNLLVGTSLAMVDLRRRHEKAVVPRVPMFATYDHAHWARPTIGLKRTFLPRVVQLPLEYEDDAGAASASAART
ncbi:small capsid protein [Bovine alphaherpesvirus 5]|uniref:Small capsomere-interacting protein n=1 Tax=Bovine alphaherpesvirus 5 TaxID=35244 RepID=Q6X247_9ALPH|nr:UL35 capsid protein [Bovine alphaherpesvirus 5]AAR86126.1 UL35 capsid protein [Bovine alphaherpesvirus 5]AQM74737.1 small capsid protein [Bovine alphaherpesvirus 5]ART33248.1 small capsid protein [Bovine alphaherpesvirus 5]QVY10556.1 UL35 capsid protein [Bovine alphaherpesvirus 5]UHJ15448.1 UL35 capsid protein [Bovine alphaherpesvirus 5]